MDSEEAVEAIRLVNTLPKGKKTINRYIKTLSPKEQKFMSYIVDTMLAPFDLLNGCLEKITHFIFYNNLT